MFLAIGRELAPGLSLQADSSYRTIRYIYEDDQANLIWNEQGTDVIGYKNADETYIWSLGTPKTGRTRRWAGGLQARYELPGWLRVRAAYEAAWIDSPSTDLVIDDYLDVDDTDFSWLRAGGSDWIHSLRLALLLTPHTGIGVGLTLAWDHGLASGYSPNAMWGGYNNLDYIRGYSRSNPGAPYWTRDDDQSVVLNLRLNVDLAPWTGQDVRIFFELLDAADQTGPCAQVQTVATPADQLGWACGGLRAGLGMRYRI